MMGGYAARDQVSRDPIDGGIEVTEEQYQEALDAIQDPEKVVRIDNGFEVKNRPQPQEYWTATGDRFMAEPGEEPPQGLALVPPPTEFHSLVDGQWTEDSDSLALADEILGRRVNGTAGRARLRFISDGTGQSAVYMRKLKEAREYQSDSSPVDEDYPRLNAEAQERGITISDLASEVVARNNAWVLPEAQIEAKRVAGKERIRNAATISDKMSEFASTEAALDAIVPA